MLIFLENAVKISGGGLASNMPGGDMPHDTSHSFSSHKVGRSDWSVNCQINNTQILSLCFDLIHVLCNSCMFLVFHKFEMKYSAGV